MPDFSQSLTVRILGDSSHLDRTLAGVLTSLDRLQQRINQISRTPITLNVAPALQSLAVLQQQLQRTLTRIQPPAPISLPTPTAPIPAPRAPINPSSINNHFGSVNIQVQRPNNANLLIQELQSQAVRQQTRRG